jgi:hypothetical protein
MSLTMDSVQVHCKIVTKLSHRDIFPSNNALCRLEEIRKPIIHDISYYSGHMNVKQALTTFFKAPRFHVWHSTRGSILKP